MGDAETDEERLSAILALTAQMGELGAAILEAVQELEDVAQSIPGFLTATRIAETLPLRLCDYLLVSYARRFQPRAYSVLNLIGIMELEPHAACPDIFQPTFELAVIHWDRLSMLFTNPRALVNSVYQWETDFDSVKFLARLAVLMRAFTIPGGLYPQAPDKCKRLGLADDSVELRLPIAQGGRWPDSWGEFGVAVSESGEGPGLAVAPYVFGSAELSFDLTPNLELELAVSASLDDGLAIVLRPPFDFDFVQGFAEDEVGSIPDFSLQLNLQQKESAPELFLLGSAASSRFTLAGISITSFVSQTGGNIDLGFGAGIRALRLVIVPSEGDDFLQKLLSIDRLEAEIGLALSWSLQQGFEFSSEAQLELTIPLHISILDVIELDSIYINLAASEQGLGLRLGVSGSAQLGPFAASVNRIGIRADMDLLDLGSNDGNLGGADLSMGFLPPTGIGLSLDAVGIVGGGFIDFYEKDGRYSGVLSLVCGDIGLVAIGLITTRMPDGTDGFSMFVSITATFNPPIELSYGFTLSGVGGLIGVNRSMSTAELRKGIKTGAIDSIMFPEPRTVIANAANIIRNMRSVFPVAEGQYVIGPMLKLGWGSPVNIMVVDLGIFIEIGISGSGFEVARVVLMGQAEMALPRPEAKTIEVNIDILGILDLERKEASFQAAIEASSLMAYKMCGDCACLVSWGGRPDMALAIGG
ncbi:MAG: hypothetical protein KAJ90_00615, partial [Desulfobacterales bacterium]|nr:hypothetical protein [Desulfobacterales bacterium]